MGREQGLLTKDVGKIMNNVLKFEGTRSSEIMTPVDDAHMINGSEKMENIVKFAIKSPYSRFPVWENKTDNIIGILDVDELLKMMKSRKKNIKAKDMTKKPFFVPETKEIDDLLTEFENGKNHMAIVVDEYGKFVGIVTLDDILEEIVGDIFDKSNRESAYIKRVNKNLINVDARASIEEINKELHLGIKEDHFNTIAGFIQHRLGKIPKKGDSVKLKNVTIVVSSVTNRKIKSVKIKK